MDLGFSAVYGTNVDHLQRNGLEHLMKHTMCAILKSHRCLAILCILKNGHSTWFSLTNMLQSRKTSLCRKINCKSGIPYVPYQVNSVHTDSKQHITDTRCSITPMWVSPLHGAFILSLMLSRKSERLLAKALSGRKAISLGLG